MNAIEEILPGNVDTSYSDADPDAFSFQFRLRGRKCCTSFFIHFVVYAGKICFLSPIRLFYLHIALLPGKYQTRERSLVCSLSLKFSNGRLGINNKC